MKIQSEAPGKIIISGEHSVVYACPALATATNLYTHVFLEESDTLRFNLRDFELQFELSETEKSYCDILERYELFKAGQLEVSQVLKDVKGFVSFVWAVFE